MNDKIDHMLGMTENMMNRTMEHKDMPMMQEMYSMTSSMMGNLNHMKMHQNRDTRMMDMMESMMRSMEQVMMNMDMKHEMQGMMMKNMMNYMIMMQMNMLMTMMSS